MLEWVSVFSRLGLELVQMYTLVLLTQTNENSSGSRVVHFVSDQNRGRKRPLWDLAWLILAPNLLC